MAVITQQMRRVCNQHNRQEYARITILNNQDLVIGQIEGKVISGSISFDNSSYIRRQGNLKVLLDNTTMPTNQNGYIWTNKKCKIEIGILDILSGNIIWFNQGIFLYKSTEVSYSSTDKTLSLTLLDKMSQFSGDLGGVLMNDIQISNQGVPISSAIRTLVTQIGGENPNNVMIDEYTDDSTGNTLTVPYTITAKAGDKVMDVIKTLTELYKYHQSFYDQTGVFISNHTATQLNDQISIDFSDVDYTITSQISNDYSYIKNKVKVYGISVTPMVAVQDVLSTSNPNPINSSSQLRITFNKPLYDSFGNMIADGTDLTSYFQYSGTASNYTKAIYSSNLWQITFTISGENGKILSPKPNMIYDVYQMPFNESSFVYSSKDGIWSPLLQGTVITDGITNTTQFKLDFNKPLYDQNGNAIVSGISLKNAFTYSDGSGNSNNFLDGVYMIDSADYYILLTFANAIPNATIEINKDGTLNSSSIYDSANLIYQPQSFLMDGNTWTLADNSLLLTYQISAEVSNTDDTSPYSINNIGERLMVVNDQNIYNISQCNLRGQWELQTHSNLNEVANLTCLPIYFLDVNMLVQLYNEDLNINGKYRIDKIQFNLDYSNPQMSLTCVKLYM